MSVVRSCAPFSSGSPIARRSFARRPCVRVSAGMKLYTAKGSRGLIVEWYAQELGVAKDIETVELDMREKREHKSEWFLKVNPFGKLPALEDGNLKVFESGAILLYIAEKYGKLPTAEDRAIASQWSHFANSTLTQTLFNEKLRDTALPPLLASLDALLAKQPFIAGDSFTVSDVVVGSYLLFVPAFLPQVDLSPYPNIRAYMKRMAERPACAATVAAPRPPPPQAAAVPAAAAKA